MRAVHPGRILQRELNACGWTQKRLAEMLGRPHKTVNQICRGKKGISPKTAIQLAGALGTSAEFWLNLDSNYRLQKAKDEK